MNSTAADDERPLGAPLVLVYVGPDPMPAQLRQAVQGTPGVEIIDGNNDPSWRERYCTCPYLPTGPTPLLSDLVRRREVPRALAPVFDPSTLPRKLRRRW